MPTVHQLHVNFTHGSPTVGFKDLKARVNVKDVLRSLNTANISVMFQVTLNLSAYLINHCLAVLCKFLGNLGKRYFFLKG